MPIASMDRFRCMISLVVQRRGDQSCLCLTISHLGYLFTEGLVEHRNHPAVMCPGGRYRSSANLQSPHQTHAYFPATKKYSGRPSDW
jgi:hypothetical protein